LSVNIKKLSTLTIILQHIKRSVIAKTPELARAFEVSMVIF